MQEMPIESAARSSGAADNLSRASAGPAGAAAAWTMRRCLRWPRPKGPGVA